MNRFNDLRFLFNSFFNREKPKGREMKRVFQWRRYLEWKDLTKKEKLSAKRLLLLPVIAYMIIEIFNQNFFLIVIFLVGFLLYKKFEKGDILKK
tara:strand:+ start:2026 stop:2307 length:282 start_codon:yes stop_codon:yes gene_type:complete